MKKPVAGRDAFRWLTAAVVGVLVASQACAEVLEDRLVRQLDNDGYTYISKSRTFLGRVRLVAFREGKFREIVFEPSTGEILRDIEIRSDNIPDITPKKRRAPPT